MYLVIMRRFPRLYATANLWGLSTIKGNSTVDSAVKKIPEASKIPNPVYGMAPKKENHY